MDVMRGWFLQVGAMRMRDDNIWVVEEGSGTEVVVVDRLGVCL